MFLLTKSVLLCLISIGLENVLAETIAESFSKHGVVPDVVKTAPTALLRAKFPYGDEVTLGNELTPAGTSAAPTVSWPEDPNSLYTFIMIDADANPDRIHLGNSSVILWTPSKAPEDSAPWLLHPDAPSRQNPVRRNWLHWLVVNIPGKSLNKGSVLAEYNGPAPPKDTGAHRYVFLVFKQNDKINFAEHFPAEEKGRRANFNLSNFTTKYQLSGPIAGNFFQAKSHQH
ncbi:hypothetical protein O0L34_g15117 [Tuta absoluta]|nr:hypothetical protein O0L34_g15117 [Tuta absoluta]